MTTAKQLKQFPKYLIYPKEGKVYSLITKRFLKPLIDTRGYCRLTIVNADGVISTQKIHRLIAATKKNKPRNWRKLTVNHDDLNKENNSEDNLSFMTARQNTRHYWEKKRSQV
jgi:DNA topoisomerase IA